MIIFANSSAYVCKSYASQNTLSVKKQDQVISTSYVALIHTYMQLKGAISGGGKGPSCLASSNVRSLSEG